MRKNYKLFFASLIGLFGFTNISAQCPSGEIELMIEIITDAYGYETYWELTPQGEPCGSNTVTSGGSVVVGCLGGGVQNQDNMDPSVYEDNTVYLHPAGCVTYCGDYSLHLIDDWGDGGASFNIYANGYLIHSFDGYGTGIGITWDFSACAPSAYGAVYQDLDLNCQQAGNEIGIAERSFLIQPGNIIVQSNNFGVWAVDSLNPGIYTISADTTLGNWQATCPTTQTFTILNIDSTHNGPNFGFVSNFPCPEPDISIQAPFLRPGFSNQGVYVQACNLNSGTEVINNAFVIVELDSLLTVQSGSLPYTSLGNDQYSVLVGDLFPGECVNFILLCSLSTSAILGQSLCLEAELFPIDTCSLDTIPATIPTGMGPCNTAYDLSHLTISPTCNNDTISFLINNEGTGDMTCYSQVRIFIDGVFSLIDSVQLMAGNSINFSFPGDGQTWRIEVDQHPLHPGNSKPSATIELCGNSANWTPNLVNNFPQDDADPVIDIFCGIVTGSYDPNDKTATPFGVGSTHDILPGQDLEYLIRFQNTGTDTAFNIVIRDTLSEDLDIFSVISGVSSDDYQFRMYGPRVLEWTFSNIMLPDSNTNEMESHGFVNFKVNQASDLELGTVINNQAAIYFDFNPPIFTNTSWITINIPSVPTSTKEVNASALELEIFPNPTTGITHILNQEKEDLEILVFDNLGRLVLVKNSAEPITTLDLSDAISGIYYISVRTEEGTSTKKIVKW